MFRFISGILQIFLLSYELMIYVGDRAIQTFCISEIDWQARQVGVTKQY